MKRQALFVLRTRQSGSFKKAFNHIIHQPKPEDKDKIVIYDENWLDFYNENLGYKTLGMEKSIEIF